MIYYILESLYANIQNSLRLKIKSAEHIDAVFGSNRIL